MTSYLLFPVVYAAVGSQGGDNIRVIDRVFIGPFDITAVSHSRARLCAICAFLQPTNANKFILFLCVSLTLFFVKE